MQNKETLKGDEKMPELRIQLKCFLEDHYLAMNTLDEPTKEKQKEIQEFLDKIQNMIFDAHQKIAYLSQNYLELKKIFDLLYEQLKQVNIELEKNQLVLQTTTTKIQKLKIDIKTYEDVCDAFNNQITIFTQQLNDKEKEYKEAVGKCFIPFVGFYYISRCSDIRHKEIPEIKKNIDRLITDKMSQEKIKETANMNNMSLIVQVQTTRIFINDLNSKKEDLIQQTSQKKKEIKDSVNQIVYYSILQEKLNNFFVQGNTLDQVLALLDKEPDIIHYEDQTYFDVLKAYYDHPYDQVFEKYMMDAQKQMDIH